MYILFATTAEKPDDETVQRYKESGLNVIGGYLADREIEDIPVVDKPHRVMQDSLIHTDLIHLLHTSSKIEILGGESGTFILRVTEDAVFIVEEYQKRYTYIQLSKIALQIYWAVLRVAEDTIYQFLDYLVGTTDPVYVEEYGSTPNYDSVAQLIDWDWKNQNSNNN